MRIKGKTLTVFNTSAREQDSDAVVAESQKNTSFVNADMSSCLPKKVWNEAFEIKTDQEGNKYLFGKLPLATQQGITMYVDGEQLELPSIFDGLPIDSVTLYWEETTHEDGTISKILKAQVHKTLGSLENIGEWADSIPENDRVMVQKAGSELWEGIPVSEIGSASFENISEDGEGNAYTSFIVSEDKKYLTLIKGLTLVEEEVLEEKLQKFVNIEEEQTITGKKNFTSLYVNGQQIVYNSTNGCWELEGDLSVSGTISSAGGGGDGGSNIEFHSSLPSLDELSENVLYVIG